MLRKSFMVMLASLILVSCKEKPEEIEAVAAKTVAAIPTYTAYTTYTPYFTNTPYPTQTPVATYTPYPTYTRQPVVVVTATLSPTPKFTPTATIPPTETPTATKSPTPIPLNAFKPLYNWEALLTNSEGYKGQLVRAFTQPTEDKSFPDYFMYSPDYGPRGAYCYLVADSRADESVKKLGKLDWMWIYAVIIESKNDKPQLSVVHIEEIPYTKQPKFDDLYQVGVDIEPGRWKSVWGMTDTDACYWARYDSNGNIIDNYFGISGITMSVSKNDAVIKFEGCGPMFYLDE